MPKFIVGSVPFFFVVALAGTAAARRPPALAEAQESADRVYATCTDSRASNTAYRDMHARLSTPRTKGTHLAMSAPLQRKMGDHLVLVCKGGELHLGSGYRGFPARLLREEAAAVQIANASELSRNR